jgi:hypothetical protein
MTPTTTKKTLDVTELDFDQIKANLKTYFTRSDSPYKDWNFEGSGLNLILDILAYNTHYNAMLAHMTFNESFIDSAQLRANVVSRAKLLGYVPRSRRGARAVLKITFSGGAATVTPYSSTFTAEYDGNSYTFTALDDGILDNAGTYTVTVSEGTYKSARYSVNESQEAQTFVIEDTNVDTSTLFVKVYANVSRVGTGEYKVFKAFSTLVDIDENSDVYFINENTLGKYEISFGDGILGSKLTSLNVVEIGYISTASGAAANGAGPIFQTAQTGITISEATVASGGGESETIESIRFNAPNSLITQNRAVTANDYRAIITSIYPELTALNIWGGDEEAIAQQADGALEIWPYAGKVYICPNGVTDLIAFKTNIDEALKNRRVFTVNTVVIPPDKTYLYFDTYLKYAANRTTKNAVQLSSTVKDAITAFSQNTLQNFGGVFRYSSLLRTIDSSEDSVLNSLARVYFYKNYTLPTTSTGTDKILFPSGIAYSDLDDPSIKSTSWTVPSGTYAGTYYFQDSGSDPESRDLNLVNSTGSYALAVGTVNLLKGSVSIYRATSGFVSRVISGTVKFYAQPVSDDIAAIRDQILEIDAITTTVQCSPDELSQMGSTVGGTSYETFIRAGLRNP